MHIGSLCVASSTLSTNSAKMSWNGTAYSITGEEGIRISDAIRWDQKFPSNVSYHFFGQMVVAHSTTTGDTIVAILPL